MAISTNGTVLTRLAGALYNTQMSNATYEEVKALDPSSLANALYARDFSSSTDATVATTLVTNLGLTAVEGLTNWVAAQLTAAGSAKGAKIVELLNGFAQMSTDATYGAYATAFNTKVDAALALSQTAGSAGGTFAAAADAAAAAAIAPKSFTLTTEADAFTGGAGADTFGASNTTLTAGDNLNGGAGSDVLTLTLNGSPAAVEMSSVETVNAKLIASSTVDATLWTGVADVNVGTTSIAAADLTVTGADFATTFSMASGKVNGLSVTYLDGSGTADTAKLSLGGLGSSTADAAVTVTGNTTEAATISTSGKNYVDLTLGTAAKSVTITGSGTNYIDVVTSATSTTIDASAATGALDLDLASGLTAGDVVKGGAAADKLTATIASTATLNPTISGVETFALTFGASANFDLAKVTDVATITLADGEYNWRFSNAPASLKTVTLADADTSADPTLRLNYATGANSTVELKYAPNSKATAGVEFGAVTLTNAANVTVSATGSYSSTVGDIALDKTATSFAVSTSASTGDLIVGAVDGDELTSITATATSGDATVGNVTNGNATLTSLTVTAADSAAVTVGTVDTYDATDDLSSLESITISGGAYSVVKVGNITAAGAATDSAPAVAISVAYGAQSATSDVGTIGVAGVESVSITLGDNAGAASEVGLITAEADDVGAINVTLGNNAILEFDGVTADEGDIESVTVTTGISGVVSAIAGAGNAVAITATKGDIGNITTSSGNAGVIELTVTSTAGSIGDVSITSKANDVITLVADDALGNVTASVTYGDLLDLTITDGDALAVGNITVTGAGDLAFDVDATSAGNITVTSSNTDADVDLVVDLSAVISAGTVSITGGAGDDTLKGAATADTIIGGAGADAIYGGDGADDMTGGTGVDTFYITATGSGKGALSNSDKSMAMATVDIIRAAATDKINLTAALESEADYDAMTVVAAGDAISLTLTTNKVSQYTGVYDSATGLFTSSATLAASTASTTDVDANLYLYANADATDTVATDAILVIGVAAQADSAMANGVLTLA
jgi:S-layer protein